jgi:hypothetical protein
MDIFKRLEIIKNILIGRKNIKRQQKEWEMNMWYTEFNRKNCSNQEDKLNFGMICRKK